MNEKLANLSQIARKFVEQQIDAALRRNGLSYDCPVRTELERDIELIGDRDAAVRVCCNGRSISLDERIAELQDSPELRAFFPDSSKLRIKRNNQREIQENFEAIVRGDAIVE